MSNKHYILVPGYVFSQTDDDRHYITWQQLQKLYGLQRGQFSVKRGSGRQPYYDPPLPEGKEVVSLTPRFNGDYSLPE